jgi:GDPmannose 4,6-dehydratase
MKVAFILGITGQDGSYLSEILLEKGYDVWGIIRRASNFNTNRIEHIRNKMTLRYGDITDNTCIIDVLNDICKLDPEKIEIYNLAAQSHVKISFEIPMYTSQVDALGTLNVLEAIRHSPLKDRIRFYQASTSELYGKVQSIPQNEETPFYPRSPYGCAKLYGFWIVKNYRESYGLFACNGILFNHSSPRRPDNFILKKITSSVKRYKQTNNSVLTIGNLESRRDIGYAKEYCEGMWRMIQQEDPDDFVLATNETYSIREMIEIAFKYVGVNIIWRNHGIEEKGYCSKTNNLLVEVDSKYFRPCEVDLLIGDYSKAKEKLDWEPQIKLKELIELMLKMNYDYEF